MESTLQKWGNSFALRIPKTLVNSKQLQLGQTFTLTPHKTGFVAQPKAYYLEALVEQITTENKPEYITVDERGLETVIYEQHVHSR